MAWRARIRVRLLSSRCWRGARASLLVHQSMALLVPDALNALQRVQFIATVVEPDWHHSRHETGGLQLVIRQCVVEPPGPLEAVPPLSFGAWHRAMRGQHRAAIRPCTAHGDFRETAGVNRMDDVRLAGILCSSQGPETGFGPTSFVSAKRRETPGTTGCTFRDWLPQSGQKP